MALFGPNDIPPEKGRGSKPTKLQLRFIDEYLLDYDGPAACKRAGYATKNVARLARELIVHPNIAPILEERMAEKRERNAFSEDYIIQKLIAMAERLEQQSPGNALRALELLGKTLGMFKERQEISGPDGKAIEYQETLREDVEDFNSAMARLSRRQGTSEASIFSDQRATGGT